MGRPDKLRVVFAGHTGLNKNKVLTRLREHVIENLGDVKLGPGEKKLVEAYDAEEFITDKPAFLGAEVPHQRDIWSESLHTAALKKLQDENPRYAFLSLHLTYQWRGLFSSPISYPPAARSNSGDLSHPFFDNIKDQFQPDYFVTLIDDIYAAHRIIRENQFNIRMRELLIWRELEATLADFIAFKTIAPEKRRNDTLLFPYERSPVVAVKHPPEMLFRLLFEPNNLRIYISFPITSTRVQKEFMDEIDDFRERMHAHFVVYDPVTIDELPLLDECEPDPDNAGAMRLPAACLWPIVATRTLNGAKRMGYGSVSNDELSEIQDRTGFVANAQTILEREVEKRDFRLIDQADCLVSYRPMFRGDKKNPRTDFSGGTRAEWDHAERTGKTRILIHDENDGTPPDRVFRPAIGDIPDVIKRKGIGLDNPSIRNEVFAELMDRLEEKKAPLTKLRLRE